MAVKAAHFARPPGLGLDGREHGDNIRVRRGSEYSIRTLQNADEKHGASKDFFNRCTWYLIPSPYSKGNAAYADVWKIGHELYRTDLVRQLERDKASPEEQKARLPNQTFRDRITLYLGGKEIQVLYLGRAHTRGDSIIYVPQDRIVYLSEIFSAGQFLFMGDGYGLDWLKTVETAAGLDADIFVPGHSPLPADPKQTREEFLRYRQMLVDVRDSVAQAIARGATEEAAVATIQWPQYEKLRGYETQRPTVIRRLYRQLTGALP